MKSGLINYAIGWGCVGLSLGVVAYSARALYGVALHAYPEYSQIYAGAAVGAVIWESVGGAIAMQLWRNDEKLNAFFMILIVAGATGFTARLDILMHIGGRADLIAQRDANVGRAHDYRAHLAELRQQRGWIASSEISPPEVIEANIRALLLTEGAGNCVKVDGPVTRQICPQVADLRVKLARAKELRTLDDRIRRVEEKMSATPVTASGMPEVDWISLIIPDVKREKIEFFTQSMGLLFFILVRMLGLPVALAYLASLKQPAQTVEDAELISTQSDPEPTKREHPVIVLDPKPIRDIPPPRSRPQPVALPREAPRSAAADRSCPIERWLSLCTVVDKDGRVEGKDLYSDYVNWCRGNSADPMSYVNFGKATTASGIAKDRKGPGGRTCYIGLSLREQRNAVAVA